MVKELALSRAELHFENIFRYGRQFLRFDVINYGTREIVQGMARNRIWQFKRVSRNRIAYEILGRFKDAVEEDDEKVLRDFLMLDINLNELHAEWCKNETFKRVFDENRSKLEGIRHLKPGIVEVILRSVLVRLTGFRAWIVRDYMDKFCKLYGQSLELEVDGERITFYNVPTFTQIIQNLDRMEDELKEHGFGKNGSLIINIFRKLDDLGGIDWLQNQMKQKPEKAYKLLRKSGLTGIGKVSAAVICSYGFGMTSVITVNDRLYNVTSPLYLPHLPRHDVEVSLRKEGDFEKQIRRFYRKTFPTHPAWVATILIASGEIYHEKLMSTSARSKKRRRCAPELEEDEILD